MPYVCMIRTDIDDGTLQLLDLWPNTSLLNPMNMPAGQTKYVRRCENDTVVINAVGANTVTDAAYEGVAAYLLDNVEQGGLAAGTDSMTALEANTIAAAIVTAMDAGTAMGLAAVNTLIAATAANSELSSAGGSNSTGSLAELLQVLAGGQYLLPAASAVQAPTGTFSGQNGSITANYFRHSYDTGAFNISFNGGELSELLDATYSYVGVAGAAVVVYTDAGAVYA